MPTYLLIANKTLVGDEVLAAVRERASKDTVFQVVVPDRKPVADSVSDMGFMLPTAATGAAAFPGPAFPGPGPGPRVPSRPRARQSGAQRRLQALMDVVVQTGAEVHGVIAPDDPMDTIRGVLADQEVDEVLLSTLPPGVSRWLRRDLPSRVRRAFDGPVTVIESSPVAPG